MKDYNSITISRQVPCGRIDCIFTEDEHVFHKLKIKPDLVLAEKCHCGESWLSSIAKIITYAMRRSIWEGNTKEGIIKQLTSQRCPLAIVNKEHNITSCADAIARCVLEYSKSRDLIQEEHV